MRMPLIVKPAAQLDVRAFERYTERSPAGAPRRDTRTRVCRIELPRKSWDRIVLFMFTCSLFTFLHALLGLDVVDEDLRALNDVSVLPRAPLPVSSLQNQGSRASNADLEMDMRGVTRVIVDWHGNYELLPSTTPTSVSPASIPQDAFPEPTSTLIRAGRGRTLDKGILSMTTDVKPLTDTPFAFYEAPYDPFRLVFEGSVDRGEIRGLYPVVGPPRTVRRDVRTRHFGGCFPGEATCP